MVSLVTADRGRTAHDWRKPRFYLTRTLFRSKVSSRHDAHPKRRAGASARRDRRPRRQADRPGWRRLRDGPPQGRPPGAGRGPGAAQCAARSYRDRGRSPQIPGPVPGRQPAAQVMEQLQDFRPYLTGAVLNGTAGEHDDIHLQLFADSAKDVILFLLDRDVPIDISETPHFKGGRHDPVETVSFHWKKQQVHAELYEMNDLRGALKPRPDGRPYRADLSAVLALLDSGAPPTL